MNLYGRFHVPIPEIDWMDRIHRALITRGLPVESVAMFSSTPAFPLQTVLKVKLYSLDNPRVLEVPVVDSCSQPHQNAEATMTDIIELYWTTNRVPFAGLPIDPRRLVS